jgi:hypothetical protein
MSWSQIGGIGVSFGGVLDIIELSKARPPTRPPDGGSSDDAEVETLHIAGNALGLLPALIKASKRAMRPHDCRHSRNYAPPASTTPTWPPSPAAPSKP